MTYPVTNSLFTNEQALEWLIQIAVLNSRLLLIFAICLLLVRYFKGSAAKRHLVVLAAFFAAVLLPFSIQWIPAIEIVVDVELPISSANSMPEHTSQIVTTASITNNFNPLLFWVLVYLSISLFFIFRILHSNFATFRLFNQSSNRHLEKWHSLLIESQQKIGVNNLILLRHSRAVNSPLTWGFRQPIILIPTNALFWSDEMKRSALLHELAHIKRKDCISKQLARLVCAIYWINPLCWLALRQFSDYAESASDDMALNSGIKLSQYAENLLDVAIQVNQCRRPWALAALSMVGLAVANKRDSQTHSQLGIRVNAILNPNGCRSPISWVYLILTFLLVLGILLPISSLKANIVQKSRYVITHAHTVTPVSIQQQKPASPIGDWKFDLSALDDKHRTQLKQQRELKQITQSKLQTPPLPQPELIEIPIKVVLEEAKNKIRRTLNNVGKKEHGRLLEESVSNINKTVNIDEIRAIDLASVMGIHNTVDHYKPTYSDLRDGLNKANIEPYTAEEIITPRYPRRAQSRGIEGELLVEFDINSDGTVKAAKVINAQPSGIFDRAVLKAVEQNRYTPQKVGGKAVTVSGVQEKYVFVIET